MHVFLKSYVLEQMSKLSFDLDHNKKIQTNLDSINRSQKQQCEQTMLKLQKKIKENDTKKQQRDNQKLKSYKLQQEKWNQKMQSIESKIKSQNRQAIRKAEKYRQDSQKFWEIKSKQIRISSLTHYQEKNKINKSQNQINQNNQNTRLIFTNKQQRIQKNKNHKMKISSFFQMNDKFISQYPKTSRVGLNNNRTLQIQQQIMKHKSKKILIQKQRQQIVFQNALKRLAKIEERRKMVQKLKQKQKLPTKIIKSRVNNDEQDQSQHKDRKNKSNRASSQLLNKPKSINHLNESISAHLKAKKQIQQEQFKQMDKILQNSNKKARKNQIMRNIKDKIKQLKSSALKIQCLY